MNDIQIAVKRSLSNNTYDKKNISIIFKHVFSLKMILLPVIKLLSPHHVTHYKFIQVQFTMDLIK